MQSEITGNLDVNLLFLSVKNCEYSAVSFVLLFSVQINTMLDVTDLIP